MKSAGSSTKTAAKKTGSATKKETKKAMNKTAKKTAEGEVCGKGTFSCCPRAF
jgi:hypothetical protein